MYSRACTQIEQPKNIEMGKFSTSNQNIGNAVTKINLSCNNRNSEKET
jgi:hypothetical protein